MPENLATYFEMIFEDEIEKIVFSNPRKFEDQYKKITLIKKENFYHIEKRTEKQVFHENIEFDCIPEYCMQILAGFKQMNAWSNTYEYSIRFSKKEKILFNKKALPQPLKIATEHNRKKRYLLEEGIIIQPLVDMGIFSKEGKVIHSMYDKYKQINKFIEIIDTVIEKSELESINIIDFGCGKSYLTFVVYYYLTVLKNIKANIIGLDLKEDVIVKCNNAANKYGYDALKFVVGDINGYKPTIPVDMVISLHACDVATDYALYNAICWNAKMIISVPCCQHELNQQLTSEELAIFQRYGIVKERVSALMTDAIRANLLEYFGYKTQLLEFVDFEHTPKNILIRAIKTNISPKQKYVVMNEIKSLTNCFNLNPKLFRLLEESNMI